jgi:protein-tyrosine sulfotransferase
VSLVFDLLGYRNRWRLLERFGAAYVSETAPIVIGGCGSSGTTLVRRMLNRHPEISCGPESTVFLDRVTGSAELGSRMGFRPSEIEAWQRDSRSQAEFIDLFQAACLARAGKRLWADKTPENIRRLSFVWRHFPGARFIHVIRDGRDVACSLRRQSWMKLEERDSLIALLRCGEYWVDRVAIRRSAQGDPRYIELRYEDLAREPEKALRPILAFLGLDWSDQML